MDNLPKFLVKAIQNAAEEFQIITYSVHGDNEKTRISIMFSKTECKYMKRKSVSALRRDTKRMKEYSDNKVKEINSVTGCIDSSVDLSSKETIRKTVNYVSIDEPNMEIESAPLSSSSCTSTTVVDENFGQRIIRKENSNRPTKPVINPQIDLHKQKTIADTGKQRIIQRRIDELNMEFKRTPGSTSSCISTNKAVGENIGQCINSKVDSIQTDKPVDNSQIDLHKQKTLDVTGKQKIINTLTGNTIDCDMDAESTLHNTIVFEKIVLKKSRMTSDFLIGKCSNGRLIAYNIHQKIFRILDIGDGKFDWYKQCVEKDFEDVRETIWYTDKIKEDIDAMNDYLTKTMN